MDGGPTVPAILALALAMAAAGVMGFAIQRGATCMVAAVDAAVNERRFGRSLALLETAVWVSGLIGAASLLGAGLPTALSYPAGWAVLAGGALLGIGALVHGACVFGAVARLGSGERHYLLTPIGFFGGALLHRALAMPALHETGTAPGPGAVILLLFAPLAIWRLAAFLRAWDRRSDHIWQPHEATIVIGIAFVVLLALAGPWTYSQILVRLAQGGMGFRLLDAGLFAALVGGAVIGGRSKRAAAAWTMRGAFCCLAGGALMGVGSAMIPGGNDNLILVGLPMAMPYAWQAIAAMVLAIWAGLIVQDSWRKKASAPSDRVVSG